MTFPDDELSVLQSEDMARALKWWHNASDYDKMVVGAEIQRNHMDPIKEVMSRFAAIGFCYVQNKAKEVREGQ